jgi:hypothetical protein
MSNIIDINELRKQINEERSVEEWTSFAKQQASMIETYQQQLKTLHNKNHQLESLLMSKFTEPLITHLTPEEQICIEQIDRLQKLSSERALILDEVKRLDLLVKNLKLIREESTIIVNQKSDNLKEADLVAIIRSSESPDTKPD